MTNQYKTEANKRYFIDVDYLTDPGQGNSTAGSLFMSKVPGDKRRVVTILAEGEGTGVRARVTASLTATMALRLAEHGIGLDEIAEIILRPAEREEGEKIVLPEFSLLEMSSRGRGVLIEYGHPSIRLFRRGVPEPLDWTSRKISGDEEGPAKELLRCEIKSVPGDRFMLFTEAFIQKFGSPQQLDQLIVTLLKEKPEISSRAMVHSLYTSSFTISAPAVSGERSGFTAASMNLRRPRRVLVATGAPFDKGKDLELARRLAEFEGKKAICGGTTARIVGRELGREVILDVQTARDDVPPVMLMENIDLITEGTITLGRAVRILEHGPGTDFTPRNAAERLVALLLESDIVHFLVGTRINETHQDPNLPAELEIRRNVVRRIAGLLETEYIKEVEVKNI